MIAFLDFVIANCFDLSELDVVEHYTLSYGGIYYCGSNRIHRGPGYSDINRLRDLGVRLRLDT